jgi:hypothetical protein
MPRSTAAGLYTLYPTQTARIGSGGYTASWLLRKRTDLACVVPFRALIVIAQRRGIPIAVERLYMPCYSGQQTTRKEGISQSYALIGR